MSNQGFLFPPDLNPDSDGGLLRKGGTVPLLSKSDISQDHPFSSLTLWTPGTFLSTPVPREEVCFSAANQASWQDADKLPCHSYNPQRALPSLSPEQFPKQKSFADLETEGLACHPWFC